MITNFCATSTEQPGLKTLFTKMSPQHAALLLLAASFALSHRNCLIDTDVSGSNARQLSDATQSGSNGDRNALGGTLCCVVDQEETAQEVDNQLPMEDGSVLIPVQSWPQRPGPRFAKISVHYPHGASAHVNEHTGIMLTLHNWGGEDCAGTADPKVLANQFNVVAICVNYLQSGKTDSIDASEPYDCGYLQALDALRALAYVRAGLRQSSVRYDDGRIFCTGGSGGGNVTLMARKFAPRTFACVIDICGMKKLSDDIAFNLPGGSDLNARWSRDSENINYLSPDDQSIRFVGNPEHLARMKSLSASGKIIIVHGRDDTTCPFADAEELVNNLQSAHLDVEAWFIGQANLDGKVFTGTGHALGNRTEIVLQVAGKYLKQNGAHPLRRNGLSDFDLRDEIIYPTQNGRFVISYAAEYPVARFIPTSSERQND